MYIEPQTMCIRYRIPYCIMFIVFITHYTDIELLWQVVLAVSIDIYTFLFTPVKF